MMSALPPVQAPLAAEPTASAASRQAGNPGANFAALMRRQAELQADRTGSHPRGAGRQPIAATHQALQQGSALPASGGDSEVACISHHPKHPAAAAARWAATTGMASVGLNLSQVAEAPGATPAEDRGDPLMTGVRGLADSLPAMNALPGPTTLPDRPMSTPLQASSQDAPGNTAGATTTALPDLNPADATPARPGVLGTACWVARHQGAVASLGLSLAPAGRAPARVESARQEPALAPRERARKGQSDEDRAAGGALDAELGSGQAAARTPIQPLTPADAAPADLPDVTPAGTRSTASPGSHAPSAATPDDVTASPRPGLVRSGVGGSAETGKGNEGDNRPDRRHGVEAAALPSAPTTPALAPLSMPGAPPADRPPALHRADGDRAVEADGLNLAMLGTTPARPAASNGSAGDAGSATEARIAAPLDSPAFAPALGAQVSLFIRDGVKAARLQLNPADMGPVSVQIALDGAMVRVEFQAARAATRDLIEASLHALAGALQDAGLTLTGGGVFQQHPGRQPPPEPGPTTPTQRTATRNDNPALPAPTRAIGLRRSLVDLVA